MKRIWRDLRGFFRALQRVDPTTGPRVSSSLAKTLKESTHVRGGHGTALPRAGTEAQHKIVAEGHEHYTKSFEKDD